MAQRSVNLSVLAFARDGNPPPLRRGEDFNEDDPVYGEYFDRERIIATLKDLWSAGPCEPETLETISNFIGVDLLELIND